MRDVSRPEDVMHWGASAAAAAAPEPAPAATVTGAPKRPRIDQLEDVLFQTPVEFSGDFGQHDHDDLLRQLERPIAAPRPAPDVHSDTAPSLNAPLPRAFGLDITPESAPATSSTPVLPPVSHLSATLAGVSQPIPSFVPPAVPVPAVPVPPRRQPKIVVRPPTAPLGDLPRLRAELDLYLANSSPNHELIYMLGQMISDPKCNGAPSSLPTRQAIADAIAAYRGNEVRGSFLRSPWKFKLEKLPKGNLTRMSELLGLTKSGTKLELARRIMEFIDAPTPSPTGRSRSTGSPGGSRVRVIQPARPVQPGITNSDWPDPAVSAATSSTVSKRGRQATGAHKFPRIRTGFGAYIDESLSCYDFTNGESPYNEPMGGSLCTPRFASVTSNQLDYGQEPALAFRTPRPVSGPEYADCDVQVHLRCFKVETRVGPHSWKQSWPFPIYAKVNGHNVTLNQAQRYTNGKLAGSDAATNITPYLRRFSSSSNNDENHILIKRQRGVGASSQGQFVFVAQQVCIKSVTRVKDDVQRQSDQLWSSLARSEKPEAWQQVDQEKVMEMMNQDGLSVEFLRASLRCPLSLLRMRVPVRSKLCTHVQCFDLEGFIEYSRKSFKFECPFCNKNNAQPGSLIISPYIQAALRRYPNADDVEILTDGSMREVEQLPGNGSDSSGDEDDFGSSTGKAGKREPNVVCVDLTGDSDEERDAPNAGGAGSLRRGPSINTNGLGPPAGSISMWGSNEVISIDDE